MRSVFLALAALLVVTTNAVSLQILKKNHVKSFAQAQATKREMENKPRLFAQQTFYRLPKGELT